jgi:DNA modification methylase
MSVLGKTNIILNEDAKKISVKDNSVNLIITSPPYYGIDTGRYGGDHKKQINQCSSEKEFIDNLIVATDEMYRVLSYGGSLLINVGEPSCYRYYCNVLDRTKFEYGTSFIWDLTEDFSKQENLIKSHQLWFHFYKGNKFFINPFYTKKNIGTVIKTKFNNLHLETEQQLSEYGFIGDAFSMEVIEHFINMYSKKNDLVLDPFAGSGVTAVAALKNKRRYIINDISEDACDLSQKRLEIYSKTFEE